MIANKDQWRGGLNLDSTVHFGDGICVGHLERFRNAFGAACFHCCRR
jgi:hypothetical protein